MVILLSLAVMPLIVRLFFKEITQEKNKRNYLIICGIILVLVVGFRSRYSGSPDTDSYCKKFERMLLYNNFLDYLKADRNSALENNILFSEMGFWFGTWILSRLFSNSVWYVFLTTAFILFGVIRFIYKNSEDVMLSLIMFITLGLFTFCMNGLRQALAMTICLFAYEFVKKKKLFPFLLVISLAVMFHKSAIFALLLYFTSQLRFNFKSGVLFVAISLIFIYFAQEIVVVADALFDKEYSEEITASGGYIALMIYLLVIGFGFLFAQKQFQNQESIGVLYLSILGAIIFLMRFIFSSGYERISYYFLYYLCILFPIELKAFENKSQDIIRIIFIALCLLLFAYRMRATNFALCF